MLAPRSFDHKFRIWNRQWKAPYGKGIIRKFVPEGWWYSKLVAPVIGPFAFQPNSTTRVFEYPWVFHTGGFEKGMRVLDIGGGYSGLCFVLDKMGLDVVNVDPFFQFSGKNEYVEDPVEKYKRLNKAFSSHVQLKRCCIEQAGLESDSFDRIYSVSTIEHIDIDNVKVLMNEVYRVLKPGGLFILTVDLFLNLFPFSDRQTNEFGSNISINELCEMTPMTLVQGNTSELYGFEDFDPKGILANLEKYYMSARYPVLVQTLVLKK